MRQGELNSTSFLGDAQDVRGHGRTLRRNQSSELSYVPSTSRVLRLLPTYRFLRMAVKNNKGISVAIEHLPEDGKDDILKVGTDIWNALVPNLVHEEPIAVSLSACYNCAQRQESMAHVLLHLWCARLSRVKMFR